MAPAFGFDLYQHTAKDRRDGGFSMKKKNSIKVGEQLTWSCHFSSGLFRAMFAMKAKEMATIDR
jgi:hypothetical protein